MAVFFLAHELKMTVSQLLRELTYKELNEWLIYFRQANEEPKGENSAVLSPNDFAGLL